MTSKLEEVEQKKALLDILADELYNSNREIIQGRKLRPDLEIPQLLKTIRKRLAKLMI